MPRGRGNVKFEDVCVGQGPLVTREHLARVSGTIALRGGECLQVLQNEWIDLTRRHVVAGVRYGIEGMRVGGVRRTHVPPHLAYGKAGLPEAGIPPNAVLVFECELFELRLASTA
ncbi:MAG: FKBP-type peptidyl-prolyl cis-trans isomerase [Phycisphaerales bacterium]|nr:FKBP-type peptidyl-prolyl cis-trans isomerase [Phycisphaerales bacterium]